MAALWCPGAQLLTSVKGPGAVKSNLNLWLLECWTQVQLVPPSQPEEKLPGRRATWCRPPAPRPAWQTQVFTSYLFWEMWKHQCCRRSSLHLFIKDLSIIMILTDSRVHLYGSICFGHLQTIFIQYLYLFPQAFKAIASSSAGVQTLIDEISLK